MLIGFGYRCKTTLLILMSENKTASQKLLCSALKFIANYTVMYNCCHHLTAYTTGRQKPEETQELEG